MRVEPDRGDVGQVLIYVDYLVKSTNDRRNLVYPFYVIPREDEAVSLPVPNLDDRKFQDIVDEAKRLIPSFCPEWTNHNLSDPGVALIELFAWMTEMTLFRLNQVPDAFYTRMLNLLGFEPFPASAARTAVDVLAVGTGGAAGARPGRHRGRYDREHRRVAGLQHAARPVHLEAGALHGTHLEPAARPTSTCGRTCRSSWRA